MMSAHESSPVPGKRTHLTQLARGVAYETFWRNEWWVRHFLFDSMEDYLDFLSDAPVGEAFTEAPASEKGSPDFTGTADLEEALELARFGWHEGFSHLVSLVETIKRSLDLNLDPRRTFHDYVGFAPDVKAFLEGTPTSMINQPPHERRRITVYMNTTFDGNTADARILNRGAAVLAGIEALEVMGFSVDLRLFEMSSLDQEVHLSEFRLKPIDERVNLQKLYFPLCHPSWIRRLNFRLIEVSPNMTVGWAGAYGIPAETKLMQEVLDLGEHDILVPTIKELGIEGEDILTDARCVFEAMNHGIPMEKRLVFRR